MRCFLVLKCYAAAWPLRASHLNWALCLLLGNLMEYIILYFLNSLVLFLTMAPLGAACFFSRVRKFTKDHNLAFGVLLIFWAALTFFALTYGLSDFSELSFTLKQLTLVGIEDYPVRVDLLGIFGVWIFILPAINLSIGCNLITNYLSDGGK